MMLLVILPVVDGKFNSGQMNTFHRGGIYVHIPFCIRRCAYCAFVSLPYAESIVKQYVDLAVREIGLWGGTAGRDFLPTDTEYDSLYLGGGTPSLLQSGQMEQIIAACRTNFPVSSSPEITVEINPDSCNLQWLREVGRLGVNRVSLGIQSLNDDELKLLGRPHDAQAALRTYREIRTAGFENVSVDLIAGFPRHTIASFRNSVDGVIGLSPEHISIYLFELKKQSRMAQWIKSGREDAIDEDSAADMYELLCERLGIGGYEHYEISSFSRRGFACRHNMKYWDDNIYVGIGMGAHGMTGRHRYANREEFLQYEQTIRNNLLPMRDVSPMTSFDRFRDALLMGCRLVKGVNLSVLSQKYGVDAAGFLRESLVGLDGLGLFTMDANVFSLTDRGRLLSNQVFSRWV